MYKAVMFYGKPIDWGTLLQEVGPYDKIEYLVRNDLSIAIYLVEPDEVFKDFFRGEPVEALPLSRWSRKGGKIFMEDCPESPFVMGDHYLSPDVLYTSEELNAEELETRWGADKTYWNWDMKVLFSLCREQGLKEASLWVRSRV